MKAKCAGCGKQLPEEVSENWEMYCNSLECNELFMKKALNELSRPKKKRAKA